MRVIGPGGVVVAMALAASAPVSATRIESTARRIPAHVAAHRLLVVPVTVNGAGPYPFLLDTGATSSMVAADLARDLALPPLGHAIQQTTTAAGSALLVQATLMLGSVRREGDVISAALGAVREMDPAIRGIVGQDLLRLGNWWLDYRGRSVVEDTAGRARRRGPGRTPRPSLAWRPSRHRHAAPRPPLPAARARLRGLFGRDVRGRRGGGRERGERRARHPRRSNHRANGFGGAAPSGPGGNPPLCRRDARRYGRAHGRRASPHRAVRRRLLRQPRGRGRPQPAAVTAVRDPLTLCSVWDGRGLTVRTGAPTLAGWTSSSRPGASAPRAPSR